MSLPPKTCVSAMCPGAESSWLVTSLTARLLPGRCSATLPTSNNADDVGPLHPGSCRCRRPGLQVVLGRQGGESSRQGLRAALLLPQLAAARAATARRRSRYSSSTCRSTWSSSLRRNSAGAIWTAIRPAPCPGTGASCTAPSGASKTAATARVSRLPGTASPGGARMTASKSGASGRYCRSCARRVEPDAGAGPSAGRGPRGTRARSPPRPGAAAQRPRRAGSPQHPGRAGAALTAPETGTAG